MSWRPDADNVASRTGISARTIATFISSHRTSTSRLPSFGISSEPSLFSGQPVQALSFTLPDVELVESPLGFEVIHCTGFQGGPVPICSILVSPFGLSFKSRKVIIFVALLLVTASANSSASLAMPSRYTTFRYLHFCLLPHRDKTFPHSARQAN